MRKLFTLGRVILAIGSIHAAHGAELDGIAVCRNMLNYRPSDHLMIEAPNHWIDCQLSTEEPVIQPLRSESELTWWQDHTMNRVVLSGEEQNER